jgi:hypothetical protein
MLMRWFNKMDADRDGELQAGELREFIGAQLGTADFNTGRKLDHAIQQVTSNSSGQPPTQQTHTIRVCACPASCRLHHHQQLNQETLRYSTCSSLLTGVQL